MTQNPFEIPQQMRDLAERNIEQARAAYDQFMGAMNQALGMWSQAIPGNSRTASFKAVQDQATAFAKQNAHSERLGQRKGPSRNNRSAEQVRAVTNAGLCDASS